MLFCVVVEMAMKCGCRDGDEVWLCSGSGVVLCLSWAVPSFPFVLCVLQLSLSSLLGCYACSCARCANSGVELPSSVLSLIQQLEGILEQNSQPRKKSVRPAAVSAAPTASTTITAAPTPSTSTGSSSSASTPTSSSERKPLVDGYAGRCCDVSVFVACGLGPRPGLGPGSG
jgi:hypothetical protein